MASLQVRSRYERAFHRGAPAPAEVLTKGTVDPSSLMSWAYVVTPAHSEKLIFILGLSYPQNSTAFCIDSRGMMCLSRPNQMPVPKDGRCDISRCGVMG